MDDLRAFQKLEREKTNPVLMMLINVKFQLPGKS